MNELSKNTLPMQSKVEEELASKNKENELVEYNKKLIDNLQEIIFTNWEKKNMKIEKILHTGNFNASKDKVPWFVILPNQKYKRFWDIFVCLACIISLIIVSTDVGWGLECITSDNGKSAKVLYSTLTGVFLFDIFLNCITAKLDNKNNYIFDVKGIVIFYANNGMIVDIVSSLPYNNIFTFDYENECFMSYIPLTKLVLLLFFLRISRINKFFELIERMFPKYTNIIRLIKLFSIIIFLGNVAGNIFISNSITSQNAIFADCLIYPDSSKEGYECYFRVGRENFGTLMLYSLFTGMTLTLGTDFSTGTNKELLIMEFTLIISTIVNATIYGNVAVMLAGGSEGVSPILREKIDTMNEYMRFMKFENQFQVQIEEYHLNIWFKQRNMMYDESFFGDMSIALKKILLIQQWKQTFFLHSQLLPMISRNLILDLVIKLNPKIFMTGDIIITEGESNTEVYFTSEKSFCKVYIAGQLVKDVYKGEYFGEIATFLRSRRRTSTILSMRDSDFLYIDGMNFETLLRNYPEDCDKIKKKAVGTLMDSMKFYPSSLFAKLVPNNNIKDYLFRKCIYLADEEEDSLLAAKAHKTMDKNDYLHKVTLIEQKLTEVKNKLSTIYNPNPQISNNLI